MQKVASLRYEVIFKKAFCDIEVLKTFAKNFLGIDLKIDKVQTEKKFDPPIGNVDSRFDLYAEHVENRVIVDIQHLDTSRSYAVEVRLYLGERIYCLMASRIICIVAANQL